MFYHHDTKQEFILLSLLDMIHDTIKLQLVQLFQHPSSTANKLSRVTLFLASRDYLKALQDNSERHVHEAQLNFPTETFTSSGMLPPVTYFGDFWLNNQILHV
jgi:hypothetical protein